MFDYYVKIIKSKGTRHDTSVWCWLNCVMYVHYPVILTVFRVDKGQTQAFQLKEFIFFYSYLDEHNFIFLCTTKSRAETKRSGQFLLVSYLSRLCPVPLISVSSMPSAIITLACRLNWGNSLFHWTLLNF